MEAIKVQEEERGVFAVTVGEGNDATRHTVTLDDKYRRTLAGERAAEKLIKASFRLLLDREPREAILPKFNLRDISRYFPEYEQKIKEYL